MHMQGTPRTMQNNPVYKDVVDDIMLFFSKGVEQLTDKGVNDIILDPGFGFGKSLEHNYTLMASLDVFRSFGLPILAGVSRKSMTYRLLEIGPERALNGTTALNMFALTRGASILRVHDVREAAETIKLYNFLCKMKKQG
jgi:dihydropteroate synthase